MLGEPAFGISPRDEEVEDPAAAGAGVAVSLERAGDDGRRRGLPGAGAVGRDLRLKELAAVRIRAGSSSTFKSWGRRPIATPDQD